jgi:CubicO group peptidase (beta-lactamase class C family)
MTTLAPAAARPAYVSDGPCPTERWEERTPEAVGLRRASLDALAEHVRGRGVVVRGGYLAYHWGAYTTPGDLASARKPVISTLLLYGVQDGIISSPDETLDRYLPGLREINGGKDAAITWRHLGSQTSGYGWSERPGAAWSYNDFALALYVDTLFDHAFKADPTEVLHKYVSRPLQFEDDSHFNAETQPGVRRRGRIALSPRDHARFGLFYLRGGTWHGQQLLRRDLVDEALTSVVPADLPATAGIDAEMLPGQVSHGGGKRTNRRGPGQYSFNWWLNLPDREGKLLFRTRRRTRRWGSGWA